MTSTYDKLILGLHDWKVFVGYLLLRKRSDSDGDDHVRVMVVLL